MSGAALRSEPVSRAAIRCEIVSDMAALERLERDWWRLWERCPSATPFQSPVWQLCWWKAFGPGELATIAVWRRGDLIGLAPFYLEQNDSGARLLPIGIGVSDYLDVLCVPGHEQEVAATIAEAALALDWAEWSLENLPAGALALDIRCMRASAWQTIRQAPCPVLALAGDEALTGCVPARRRRQLRRAHRAAGRRGHMAIEPAQGIDQFLNDLIRLHGARWAGDGGGLLTDDAVERFHGLALPTLVARNLARCWTLAIDDAVVGAYYGLHHGGRAYAYLGGFDPAYADESPGSILIGHAISEAIGEGAHEFDFLRGGEAYKYSWGAEDRWTEKRVLKRAPLA